MHISLSGCGFSIIVIFAVLLCNCRILNVCSICQVLLLLGDSQLEVCPWWIQPLKSGLILRLKQTVVQRTLNLQIKESSSLIGWETLNKGRFLIICFLRNKTKIIISLHSAQVSAKYSEDNLLKCKRQGLESYSEVKNTCCSYSGHGLVPSPNMVINNLL